MISGLRMSADIQPSTRKTSSMCRRRESIFFVAFEMNLFSTTVEALYFLDVCWRRHLHYCPYLVRVDLNISL